MSDFAFYSTDIDPTTDPANADPAPETLVVLDQVPILGNAAYNLMAGEIGRGAVIQTLAGVVIQDFGIMDGDQKISFSDTDALTAETVADLRTIHETLDGEYFFTDGYDIWRVRFARRGGFRYRRNLFWAQHSQEIYGYEINLIVMASLRREIADFGLSLEIVEGLWQIADCKLPLEAAAWLTEDSKLALQAVEGGFAPSGSPAGWWPADQITGLEDGDPVGTWPDQSGNGKDLTQGTAANKPTYKVNIKNGLPVVRGDGGDYMDSSLSLDNEPLSVFAVCVQSVATNNATICSLGSNGAEYNKFLLQVSYNDRAYIWKGNGVANDSRVTDADYDDTTWYINSFIISEPAADNLRVYQNGVNKALNNSTANKESTDNFRLFSAEYRPYIGDMAEIFVYQSALSDADRGSNESGLNTKWAVH